MSTYLLDVNVLIALCDSAHVHHRLVFSWFQKTGNKAYATCPLTENAFVRICSNAAYPNRPGDTLHLTEILKVFCKQKGHAFWPDSISIRNTEVKETILPGSITDIYLLSLAIKNKGKLVSLDKNIPVTSLAQGARHFLLLEP